MFQLLQPFEGHDFCVFAVQQYSILILLQIERFSVSSCIIIHKTGYILRALFPEIDYLFVANHKKIMATILLVSVNLTSISIFYVPSIVLD